MASALENFNCVILWNIENFFPQCANNMCVLTEVEIFNSEKWKLEISPWMEQHKKSLKMVKLSGDEEMPTEKRVSVIDKDRRVICQGNPRCNTSKKEINFDMYYLNTEWLQNTTLKIELKFPIDGLAFSTTVQTVLSNAKCSFVWSIRDIPTDVNLFKFPIPVYLPRSPQCTLLFLVKKDEFDKYFCAFDIKSNKHQPSCLESDCVSTTKCKDIFAYFSIVRCVDGENQLTEGSFLLKDQTNIHHIIPDYSRFQKNVDLRACFSFFDGTSESVQQESVYSFLRSENSGVREKFAVGHSLFKNMKFHDVTLKAGDKEFKAHKSVLSYVSPVFCTMFENEMSESNTGQVLIEDVEPSTVKRMLKFIYTDEIDDVSFEQYEKLLAAANKYTISSLMKECSDRLVSLLTEKNVMRILHLGYLYNDDKLKGAVKSLFALAPQLIFESEDWKEYMERCFPRDASVFSVEKLRELAGKVKLIPSSISSIFQKK